MAAPPDHQYPRGAPPVTLVVGRDLPRASGADAARTLVEASAHGTLATLTLDPPGYPFGSIVSFALDGTGDPLFVISQLAEHTRNLSADGKASLLVAEAGEGEEDPLARGRVTLLGRAAPVDEPGQAAAVDAVAARVPAVAGYASYGDFACWRLRLEAIRWVGGFGEMDWIDVAAFRRASVDPVLPHRHGIVRHMNDDHADAGVLLCQRAIGIDGPAVASATMRSVDRFGCDYVARLPDGLALVRTNFGRSATNVADVRTLVVAMVQEARPA